MVLVGNYPESRGLRRTNCKLMLTSFTAWVSFTSNNENNTADFLLIS